MDRREASKVLLGTAVGATLGANSANAQSCVAPCYPQTPAESSAGITPSDTAFPAGDVRRYGDVTTGTDHTSILQDALAANDTITLPPDETIYINRLNVASAGKRIIGSGRFSSVLRPASTLISGDALILNTSSATGTSYGFSISDVRFELHDGSVNIDCVAIDLKSMGSCQIQRCRFEGLSGVTKNGTGVQFGAATGLGGAYFNSVVDCDFNRLQYGARWKDGANGQRLYNCQMNSCTTGVAVEGTPVPPDAASVISCRFEACSTGVRESSRHAYYAANRFEANGVDMEFGTDSIDCHIFGGQTGSSTEVLKDSANATGLVLLAPDLGPMEIRSDSASRPLLVRGPTVLSPWDHEERDVTPGGLNARSIAAYLAGGRLVMDNFQWMQSVNNAGDGLVFMMTVNAQDRVVLGDSSKGMGFFGSSGSSKATVTGSRTDGTALEDLLSALESYGLITDNTTT